ncbi:MAG TPA: hypothetical protein VGJ32_14760 [Solirubrobacteraceae bacterium]|jgi:hypothetical protein
MEQVARLIDGDAASLDARVMRALERDGAAGCVVSRFTYWYTARPPVYEAVLFRIRRPG